MAGANKGEWSELYVFFKLLADKKLYAADSELNKIENVYYPVLKILRNDPLGDFEYYTNSVIKIVDSNGVIIEQIPITEFREKALFLLNKIQLARGRSFEVRELEAFLRKIKISKIKANSAEKRDITLVVHDIFTGFNPELGFSIKSKLGGNSTLFNASKQTNFVFQIDCETELTNTEIDYINSIDTASKIRDRINFLYDNGCTLTFVGIDSNQLLNNLRIIDTALPQLIAEMIIMFYRGEATSVAQLTALLTLKNPLRFDLSENQPYYEYKIKNLLTDIALGMTPRVPWRGIYDATGGYIVVKEDGEVLCYHIYNRNEFQEYLFKETKFETPSSSRHDFGEVFEIHGTYFIKLNLQIRFK